MRVIELLLPEFDREIATTRRSLERVPEGRLDWRPHAKSWSLRELSTHIAQLPQWTVNSAHEDSLDLMPGGKFAPRAEPVRSVDELLERFDRHVEEGRAALASLTDDARFEDSWTLMMDGEPLFSIPRYTVLRSWVFNHIVHHRAQLGVYLRMLDVPVPAIYGPSADETGM